MKRRTFIRIFSILILLMTVVGVLAHDGGHYHKSDHASLNSWALKDGTIIKGNFSSGDENNVVLEQYEGKLIRIPIIQLSEQEQKLVQFKIKKYNRLNQPLIGVPYSYQSTGNIFNTEWLLLTLIFTGVTFFHFWKVILFQKYHQRKLNPLITVLYFVLISVSVFACKKSADNIITPGTTIIPKTRTGFIDSAFAPYKPSISTNWDTTNFYVASTGFPQHNMMVGITSWQQQVPIPQFYTGGNSWTIPLQPEYAAVPLSTKTNLMKGAIAIAVNGIPIFNAYNNRGVDSYLTGELDNWGGHCGRADDYHYHAAPLHLSATSGLKPIAFALDGFPVYGAKEPDGSPMQPLDTCHGHVTNNGAYHYHGTTNYPYVVGAMRGKVNLDPNTPAPENQILPQAFASPVRPALSPLNGATITDFRSTGADAYKLTYQQGTKFGYVEYSWDATNKYTYKLTDTSGAVTINVYQR